MMDAALEGRFKGLWAIGYDVYLTNPNASETRRALAAQELLVVEDMFLNGTARAFAHVILPACSSVRKGWHVHGVAGTPEYKVTA